MTTTKTKRRRYQAAMPVIVERTIGVVTEDRDAEDPLSVAAMRLIDSVVGGGELGTFKFAHDGVAFTVTAAESDGAA